MKKIIKWLWTNRGRYTIRFVDWYVRTYHSQDYIHIGLIKEEISRRIDAEVFKTKIRCDEDKERAMNALNIQHKINEDGWIAEIENMEKQVRDAMVVLKNAEELRWEYIRRVRELAVINAKNQHGGKEMIEGVTVAMQQLEKVGLEICGLVENVEKEGKKETEMLRIPHTLNKINTNGLK